MEGLKFKFRAHAPEQSSVRGFPSSRLAGHREWSIMQIAFKTKNFKLTKKVKKYIQDKLLKYNRQLPPNTFIEVNLEDIYGPKGGRDKKVHLSVNVPGEEYIHLEEKTSDIFASIDLVFKKFAKKIRRAKGKFITKRRKQKMQQTLGRVTGWIPKSTAFKLPFKRKARDSQIEKEIREISEILDEEAAIEKLKSSTSPFYLFRDRDNQKLNIIYREKRGKYKIIEFK